MLRQGETGGLTKWSNKKSAATGGKRRIRGGSSLDEKGQGINRFEGRVQDISGGGDGGSV